MALLVSGRPTTTHSVRGRRSRLWDSRQLVDDSRSRARAIRRARHHVRVGTKATTFRLVISMLGAWLWTSSQAYMRPPIPCLLTPGLDRPGRLATTCALGRSSWSIFATRRAEHPRNEDSYSTACTILQYASFWVCLLSGHRLQIRVVVPPRRAASSLHAVSPHRSFNHELPRPITVDGHDRDVVIDPRVRRLMHIPSALSLTCGVFDSTFYPIPPT